MTRFESNLREIALVGFGVFAAVSSVLFIREPVSIKLQAIIPACAFVLFLVGIGVPFQMWHQKQMCLRTRTLRVGVLKDLDWEDTYAKIATYTDVNPDTWEEAIRSATDRDDLEVKVSQISPKRDFTKYLVILNPYGGAYPEQDPRTLHTLNKIFDYVNEGGIFVNVADVPGFWIDSRKLGHRTIAKLQISRRILLTPFMERLGLYVLCIENADDFVLADEYKMCGGGRISANRAVEAKLEDENIVDPVLKPCEQSCSGERRIVTPSFFKEYGNGKFLISMTGIHVREQPARTAQENPQMLQLLAQIISKEIRRAVAGKRSCDPP